MLSITIYISARHFFSVYIINVNLQIPKIKHFITISGKDFLNEKCTGFVTYG